jgi:Protein of unknown function (DUF3829)
MESCLLHLRTSNLKTTALWVTLIGSLCLGGGCKKSGAGGQMSDKGKQARSMYAKGYNALLDDPNTMVKDFFSNVPPQGLPKEGARVHLFPRGSLTESDIKEAREAFGQAKEIDADELSHLAPLADKALTSIDKVLATFKATKNYYTAEDFKDDKGAKGKKLYGEMKQAAAAFHKALDQMSGALSKLEDAQTLAEIKEHEEDKAASYWFRFYNFKAKQALAAMRKGRFPKAFTELETAYNGLTKWKAAAGEGLTKKPAAAGAFKSYLNMTDQFYSHSKKFKRLLGEGDAKKLRRESTQLVSWYNNLVNMGNALFDLEAQGLL